MKGASVPTQLDHVVAFDEARRLAEIKAGREKSLVYVTQIRPNSSCSNTPMNTQKQEFRCPPAA